jgi:hypothetical protein
MFNKLYKLLLALLLILCFTMPVFAMPGSGTEADPYIIDDATDLKDVEDDMDAYYELANDIDLGDSNFEPIGYDTGWSSTAFEGHFDGKGYKIYNGSIGSDGVDYSSDNFIGIFAYNEGTIQNVSVDGVNVIGNFYVAGLAGYNDGTIENCYATGDVAGSDYIGGLLGANYGTIENCYATGDVAGSDYIGGLVGYNKGTIENCYVTGDVDGSNYIGGLVGYNDQGIIRYSYSTGKPTGTSGVGGLVGDKITSGDYEDTDNYWDTTTSETTTSAMGTGKTTTQMQDIDTFVGNWDMVTEANHDGDEATAVWFIDDGNDYPRLWSEYESPEISTNVLFIFSNF